MLERRGNNLYYYTYQKRAGRCRRIYVGAGAEAQEAAAEDSRRRAENAAEQAAWAMTRGQLDDIDEAIEQLYCLVELAMRTTLLMKGYHRHERGNWRKRRAV